LGFASATALKAKNNAMAVKAFISPASYTQLATAEEAALFRAARHIRVRLSW
jgi:hypothetical protein